MMEFKNILENETGRRGIMYNSLVDDNVNITLYDVNSTWEKYDFVITNTKITVGVNYDSIVSVFDQVFILVAPFNSARDILQVSCRCRKINNNNICITYDKGEIMKNFKDDTKDIYDPIYTKLFENVKITSPRKASSSMSNRRIMRM